MVIFKAPLAVTFAYFFSILVLCINSTFWSQSLKHDEIPSILLINTVVRGHLSFRVIFVKNFAIIAHLIALWSKFSNKIVDIFWQLWRSFQGHLSQFFKNSLHKSTERLFYDHYATKLLLEGCITTRNITFIQYH